MAEGSILVGSARVAIVPDMQAFGADLKAKFDTEVRALDLKIPVKFDFDQRTLAEGLAAARALGDKPVNVNVGTQVDKPSLSKTDAALKAWLSSQKADIKVGADVDVPSVEAAREAEASVGEEADKTTAKLAGTSAAEKYAAEQARQLAEADTVLAAGSRVLTDAVGAETKAIALNAAAKKTLGDLDVASLAAQLRSAGPGGPGGAGGGGADRSAFSRGFLGGTIGGVSAWHVALDLAVEGIIAVGTASAAAAVGILAASAAADSLWDHLTAVDTVSHALGTTIPPMSSKLQALQKSMAPQVIEGFGGALSLVNQQGSVFSQIGHQVVGLFDDWIARIDLWSRGQGTMYSLLHTGEGYLAQFGQIFGTLGSAMGGLLRDDPGIAHYLLDLVEAGAKLLYEFSQLPQPIVYTTLAVHGLYLWGRVLGGTMISAAKGLGILSAEQAAAGKSALSLKNVLKFFTTNPYGWAILAAAAIGGIVYETLQADGATKKLIATLDTQLANEKASTAILQIADDLGTLQRQINVTQSNAGLEKISQQMRSLSDIGASTGDRFGQFGHDLEAWGDRLAAGNLVGAGAAALRSVQALFTGGGPGAGGAWIQQARNVTALNSEMNKLVGQQRNLWHETGALIDRGNTYSQSLALMDLAGVKASDSYALMRQKVDNLVQGYQALGVRGGMLSNSVDAVTFSTEQQDSKVQQLTQAWSGFFSMLTGGETGFTSFAQAVGGKLSVSQHSSTSTSNTLSSSTNRTNSAYKSLNHTLDQTKSGLDKTSSASSTLASSLTKSNTASKSATQSAGQSVSTYQGLAQALAQAHGNITGLSAASINARAQFLTAAQAAQSEMNNLTTLSAASAMGARGQQLLAQAGRDMVGVLLPAAKHSQALTTVLYGLAQQAGYKSADSFKALSQWVGNTKNPMKQLDNITTIFTEHAGDLTTDVKSLSTALSQNLTGAMKTAIFTANGGQTAFNNYASALANNSTINSAVRKTATDLAAELLAVTGNTKDAHSEFDTMTIAMGKTKGQADKLWNSIFKVAQNEAKVKNKSFHITGTGKGTYSIEESGAGGATPLTAAGKKAESQSLLFKEAGGLIPGYGGGDQHPALLESGETVVDKDRSRWLAPVFKAAGVPGYTSGGYVGDVAGLGPFPAKFANQLGAAMAGSMVSAMQTASTAAASSFGIPGAAAAGTGPAQTIAKRLLAAMGWAAQWPALDYLWTRESGWRWDAKNPSSGAYGIPQSLPADKMAAAGSDWMTNPATQIRWGLGYIKATYGDPDGAAAHEVSHGWYDAGGLLPPGLTLAANTSGQNELVLTPAQFATLAAGGGGTAYHAHFDGLTGQAIEGHVRTAFTAMQIAEANHLRIGRPQ